MNTFVFGTMYHGPPDSNEDDWVRHFKSIKEHGFDAIKAWAAWGYLEPAPDKYDFSEWDRLFDVAHRYGLSVVPNTVIETQPFWIHRVFPRVHMVDQFGSPFLSTTAEYSCGISPGACLDHAGPRGQAEKFLTAFASHFGDRDNLLCWDAWNETRWLDGHERGHGHDKVHGGGRLRIPCHCERTVEEFRGWLERKYRSLDGLGEMWRRKYVDWADVFPPRGGRWSYSNPEMVDWRNFMLDYVVDKLEMRVNAIRRGDPAHPVMMHAGASSVRSQERICIISSDDWKLSKGVDFYGLSFYPAWHAPAPEENCLYLDAIRSASGDKPFWLAELQGGPSFHSPAQGNNYHPDDLKLWTYAGLSAGAKGILYWSWRPEPIGPSALGFGLARIDGAPTERARTAREISEVIRRSEALFSNSRVHPSQAAILFDPDLYFINFFGGTGGMDRDMVINSVHGYYRAFWDNDIWCDFVHADEMGGLNDYKLLVLPFPFCLKRGAAERIAEYVDAGGTVIGEAYLGRFEENCVPAMSVPAYGLDRVFKARAVEAEFVGSVKILPQQDGKVFKGVESLTGYYFKEGLEPLSGAEIAGRFEDAAPAIIRGRYGRGETILFGSLMALNYGRTGDPDFRKVIGNISRSVGIPAPVEIVSLRAGGHVRARVLTHDGDYVIYCLNFGDRCEAQLRLHLPEPESIREIIADSDLEYVWRGNHAQVNLEMEGKDVKILVCKTRPGL